MLYVTSALIEHNNKVLICQRSIKRKLPLKWEFPGGKIEHGESKAAYLHKEIQEELSIENLERVIQSASYEEKNIIRLNIYTTNMAELLENFDILKDWITKNKIKQSTTVLEVTVVK